MSAKVLIVEDNEKNRWMIRDILTYHGFAVIEAENGADGVSMAREERPGLILMDMQMPVMDGFAATAMLKNDPATRSIKIMAITSFAMLGDKERILALGVDDYISKPINTRELPDKVRKLLA